MEKKQNRPQLGAKSSDKAPMQKAKPQQAKAGAAKAKSVVKLFSGNDSFLAELSAPTFNVILREANRTGLANWTVIERILTYYEKNRDAINQEMNW